MDKTTTYAAMFGVLLGVGSLAQADLFVPGGYAEVEGNWENQFPFSNNARYQQVWEGSLFTETGPIEITSISFRMDGPAGAGFAGAPVFGPQIRMSTTSAGENSLATSFDANLGADVMTVRDTVTNPLHVSSTAAFTSAGTRVFDVIIEFDQAFIYDPSQGALLLDVTGNLMAGASRFFDGVEVANDGMSRMFNQVAQDNGFIDTGALVVQFNYTPVPAPGALALLGLGGLVSVRRTR
ncbi:MAG: hypothetical protein R3B67_08480 [Phycisphaerales bacterium]